MLALENETSNSVLAVDPGRKCTSTPLRFGGKSTPSFGYTSSGARAALAGPVKGCAGTTGSAGVAPAPFARLVAESLMVSCASAKVAPLVARTCVTPPIASVVCARPPAMLFTSCGRSTDQLTFAVTSISAPPAVLPKAR